MSAPADVTSAPAAGREPPRHGHDEAAGLGCAARRRHGLPVVLAAVPAAAVLLFVAAALGRLAMLRVPALAEAAYEEALVGLMAKGILEGEHITFWWGHPYLGSLPVYVTAGLFRLLAPTTPVLRLTPLLVSLVAALFSWLLARRVVGERWALLVLLWWAVPPAFLMRLGVTPFNYMGSVAYGTVVLYLTHRAVSRDGRSLRLAFALGLVWGISLWDHLISLAYIGASALALVVDAAMTERRVARTGWVGRTLFRPAWAACLGGFLGGNAPFWLWNVTHGLETFKDMVAPHVATTETLVPQLLTSALRLVELLGGTTLPGTPMARAWAAGVIAAVYLPAVVYAAVRTGAAIRRGPRGGSGLTPAPSWGVALPLLTLLLAIAQMVGTRYDLARYLAPVYCAAPVLLAVWARRVAEVSRVAAGLVVALMLAIHVADNVRLLGPLAGEARRPVDAVVAFLRERGIGHAYGHYRVAWPLAFESAGAVTATDFHGFLGAKGYLARKSRISMGPFLATLDAVDAAPRVALVTHEGLRHPGPGELAENLRLRGGSHRVEHAGRYAVFHDFVPPAAALQEVPPSALTVRASHADAGARDAIDRNISTAWVTPMEQAPGMTFDITLDRPRRLARLVLDPGAHVLDYPRGVIVEVSRDGAVWTEASGARVVLFGLDWHAGHPKPNLRGRVVIWLGPVEAHHVRIRQTAATRVRMAWSIAELFLYEARAGMDAGVAAGDGSLRRVLDAVREAGADAVYGPDEVNAFFTRHAPPPLRTVTLHEKRFTPVELSERIVRLHRRNAFFVAAGSPALERTLAEHGVTFERRPLEGGVLYLTAPRSRKGYLYWSPDGLLAVNR